VSKDRDANGCLHGPDGRFVDMETYINRVVSDEFIRVDRIFEEKDKKAESDRQTLEKAVAEAKTTTERARQEDKLATDKALAEAKGAADAVSVTITKRIELLESGGAPFASRLDESLSQLKQDVDVLKENMVRTTVLDALREQTVTEAKAQKRQIRYIAIAAAISFAFSLILIAIQVVGN
jgi:hypothetical protein